MPQQSDRILQILDQCCDSFTFPMLDNGYVYLAGTRLTLFRSNEHWSLVIEVFGFSTRSELPDTHVYTFASRLCNRKKESEFYSSDAYTQHLKNNPNNESRFVFPIDQGSWQDPDDLDYLADDASHIMVRNQKIALPDRESYARLGVELEDSDRIFVYEACRSLAATHRDLLLATDVELRANVPPELEQILQLDEWNHPDVVDEAKKPSASETFQQLAEVLASGQISSYRPTLLPNTHWANWPDGGTL